METQIREKTIVAATSVLAAVFLTGSKLIIGILTGSLGIIAEAAHSALDLAAAAVTFFAVRVSDRPADDSHLYGHGKVENLSALTETALLLLTCAWVIYEAIRRLSAAQSNVDPSLWAFLVMAVSIVIDFSRSRALARIAKKYRSQALEADALHFSTDIWSSAVVIIGLALVKFGQMRGGHTRLFERADAVAALFVALIVIFVSYQLGRRAVDALLDRAPSGLAERISASVRNVDGIRRVAHTRVRDVGSKVFVDMRIDVPRHLSFEESHDLIRRAHDAVRSVIPDVDVIVDATPAEESGGVLEKIQLAASREHVSIHNVATVWTDRGLWINLDLEVDPHLRIEQAHAQATAFEDRLRRELSENEDPIQIDEINAHIEPKGGESSVGAPLEKSEAELFAERVRAIGRELNLENGCHDIEVQKINGKIWLSFHLSVGLEAPIAEVHEIAEEMEARLRREFPRLERVWIHTEPQ
jgi:cation diffusion facilitator family transporter